jgi:MFS family permease
VEAFAVTTVLPGAMVELEAERWYSLAFAATISTSLVGMVLGGNWSDRSGPRRPLVVGGGLFLLGLVLCVLAPGAATFIGGRLLQGVGGGIVAVVLYVLIARIIPAGARPAMFGLLTTAWLVPSMAGPLVAGALAQLLSWRAVFALILGGSALALLVLVRIARPGGGPANGTAQRAAVIGRTGGLSLLAAGVLVLLHLGAQLDGAGAPLLVGAGLAALALVARRLLPPGTLRLRGAAPRLVALRAGFGVSSAVPDVYLTLYLQTERGLSPTAAGLVLAVGALGWAGGSWVQARRPSTPADHRLLILAAAPLVAAAPVGALLLVTGLVPVPVVVLTSLLKGVGMGVASARVATATLDLAPPAEQGGYSSALQSGEAMAVAASTAVAAVVLSLVGGGPTGFAGVYVLLTAVAIGAVLVAVRTPRVVAPAEV